MKFIFVVGYPRSGTTLLAETVSRLTGYTVLPETRFYEENLLPAAIFGNDLTERLSKKNRLQDLPVDIAACFDGSTLYKRTEVLPQILSSIEVDRGVVEKSPIHALHMGRIKEDFPDSIILAITRSPADVISSLKNTPWNRKSSLYIQLEWSYRNKIIINSDVVDKIVRYEDLIRNPEDICKGLLRLVGEPEDVSRIEKTIYGSRESGAVPSWEMQWKGNVNGPLMLGKEINNNPLPYVNPKVASCLGYDEYDALNNLILSNYISMLEFFFHIRRVIKKFFYRFKLNKLVGKEAEGEGFLNE